ncbi:AAA family ATPase [Fervidibacter sacchari]|uniref:DNA-directed DNA polymerase n=1 Tax=Candidatus Fervidibacter sacchari TaxID=1448929 RepID=A0ABT2ESC7_9BACT|nr:AAA family ATPase [Candidatus Fervidibacter sacchari]MCS3920760.1 DNA polymerase elongation subunit (family B) [Candidatus Fervidibacter sacchari]WKU17901.1 AAA family ATPase [Candidatus Fervidibacter sacchari]
MKSKMIFEAKSQTKTVWQVDGLIKEGDLVILSARPKTAKSIVALNLAACVAMGIPFLGRKVKQGRALFMAYERHDLTLQRAQKMGLEGCEDFMLWDKMAFGMPRIDALDFWQEFIITNGVKLFIVDTLAHFIRPELDRLRNAINAYDHIYSVMERLQALASETKCTFVMIHHDRKDESDLDESKVLGTTALTAAADAVFQLKAMEDGVISLKATGNAFDETTLYFTIGKDYWLEATDKPATSKEERAAREIEAYLRQHGQATRQELVQHLVEIGLVESGKEKTASNLFDRAVSNYLILKVDKKVENKQAIYRLKAGASSSIPIYIGNGDGGDYPQGHHPYHPHHPHHPQRVDRDNGDNGDSQVRRLSPSSSSPIGMGIGDDDPQAAQQHPAPHPTNGNSHNQLTQPVNGNQSENSAEGGEGSPQPAPHPAPQQPAHWVDVVVNVIDVVEVVDTLQTAQPPAPQPLGGVVVVTSEDWKEDESIVVVTSEDCDGSGDWQDGLLLVEAQPPTTPAEPTTPKPKPIPITDPFCLQCAERLYPDGGGIAVCVGCGKVYDVSITEAEKLRWFANKMLAVEKMKAEGDGDGGKHPPAPAGNPPEGGGQPTGGGQSPAPSAGANGQSPAPTGNLPDTGQPTFSLFGLDEVLPTRKSETKTQPQAQANAIYSTKMCCRQPDGTVVLAWKDKKESVAPAELECWQPIEEIPEANLPAIDQIPFPPVVVLDLETTDLDPAKGRIIAAGLAYFVEGKEVEAKIIKHDDEAEILDEVFAYLRETASGVGEFILTGYNLADFDLPFIIQRARRLKVACPFRFIKDDDGEIKRFRVAATEGTLKGDPLSYPAIASELPIQVVDTLHLVCKWDYTNKVLRNYDLKNVAAHFGLAVEGRPILSPAEIRNAFHHDPATFDAYLLADLRETFAIFAKLVPPYLGVAALTNLPIDKVVTRSTAWVWQEILQRYYDEIPDADEKRKYQGGLVVSREGLWFPCLKIDVASLYPTIMLAYRVHSRKDYQQVALKWLKALTKQRLELKAKAKAGDGNAQILQEAMKVLINSLYGFYGTGGYPFNDMDAAAKVTEIGRKVLTLMISAVEDAGGIVVEADTDGVIVCYKDADPQEIFNAVASAIPQPFKFEVEWQDAVVFVSGDKNYIVLDAQGNILAAKGSVWRGRDKEAYLTEAIPTFLRLWATQGEDVAKAYAKQVLEEIQSGKGWDWVVRSHKVGKGDKFLIDAGFKVGEVATYAYRDKKARVISRSPAEGYDVDFYAKAFKEAIQKVVEIIAQEGDGQNGFGL